jgi:signal peptidase I
MNDTPASRGTGRSVWLAALLSFIMPGVGQVYCGCLVRGLTFGLVYGLAIPVTFGLLGYLGPVPTVVFALLAVAAVFGVVIAATLDASKLAVRTRRDYELKACNGPAVYLLIGLMTQGSSIGYALHLRSSLVEAFRVSAASEYPTLLPGDRILADKTAYWKTDMARGDVVLFHPPTGDWRKNYIKRIVALGGDTVEIKQGELYINDQKLPRELVSAQTTMVDTSGKVVEGRIYREHNADKIYKIFLANDGPQQASDFGKITVPEDHCFVLGDNRSNSLDSRRFGPIAYATIQARADYIYWPADTWFRFGRIR